MKPTVKLAAPVLAAVTALMVGCASMPKDEEGRSVVYLQKVGFDISNPDLGLFVPWFRIPADSITKVAVGVFAGTKAASALEVKKPPMVFITYSHREGEITPLNVGHNFSRLVWDGMPALTTQRWYVLAKDDKGKYLIPCEPACRPTIAQVN